MTIYSKLFEVKKAWITLKRDTKAFNYKYATLDQIQDKLWDVLEKNWLIIIHYILGWILTTEIRDIETSEFVKSEIELTTSKPQDKWSEITYFRRYNLLSLLDLEVEDDDWKQAQDSKQEIELPWIWDINIENLKRLVAKWERPSLQDIKKSYKVATRYLPILSEMWIK